MANYISQNGNTSYPESFSIDWIETFRQNAADIAFASAAPGSGTRYAVAATGTYSGLNCNDFEGLWTKSATLISDPGLGTLANTKFMGADYFPVTSSTTVSGNYCYIPSTATIYRKYLDLNDYALTFSSVTGTNTYTPGSGTIGFYIRSTMDNDTNTNTSRSVVIQDTATSTTRLTLFSSSDGRYSKFYATPKKIIPIPFGYKMVVTDTATTAYYAELTI